MEFLRLIVKATIAFFLLSFSACSGIIPLEKKPEKENIQDPAPAVSGTPTPEPIVTQLPEPEAKKPPPNLDPAKILMFVNQPDDVYLFSGSSVSAVSCSGVPALPAGITLRVNGIYCQLEGTPTAAVDVAAYAIEVQSSDGTVGTRQVEIEVKTPSPAILGSPVAQSYFVGATIVDLKLTNTGEDAVVCYANPSLPEGITVRVVDRTCLISGTPLVEMPTKTVKIYARAADGSRSFTPAQVTVLPGSASPFCPRLADLPDAIFIPNTAISAATFVNTAAQAVSCTVDPVLPSGLTLSLSSGTCRISGTPIAETALRAYTVSATGTDGTQSKAKFQFIVTANAAPSLVSAGSVQLSSGIVMNQILFTNTGGTISTCTVAPTLPAGLSVSRSGTTCRITGTPSVNQTAATYSITGTGSVSPASTATVEIAISAPVTTQILAANGTFADSIKNFGISRFDSNVIYAVVWSGMVFKSTNGGSTWTAMCQSRSNVEGTTYGNIQISPGADGNAYIANYSEVDRIEAVAGADCPRLARNVTVSYKHNNYFAINTSGRLYSINSTDYAYSDDAGNNWTQINTNNAALRSMVIDPANQSRVLMALSSATPPTLNGFALNGVTSINSTITGGTSHRLLVSPVNSNTIVMSNSSSYSIDGGTTWATSALHWMSEFDSAGNAYKFDQAFTTAKIQKSANISSASPTWVDFYNFGTLKRQADSEIKISSSTIGVLSDSRLFISLNSGTTFNEVSIIKSSYSPRTPTVVAKDNTLYIFEQSSVRKSTDEGLNWSSTLVAGDTSSYDTGARIISDPNNASHFYLFSERYNSTYNQTIFSTFNAFASVNEFNASSTSAAWYSWASVAGISKADPNIFMVLGWSKSSVSTDGLATVVHKTVDNAPSSWFVWYPNQEGAVSPWNSNQMFYIDTNSGTLWKYDNSGGTNISMNSALSFPDPSGLDMIKTGASSYELRVVSRTGRVDKSTDGTTFTVKGQTAALSSGAGSILKHAPHNPDLTVTARLLGNSPQQTAISYNGGVTWRPFNPACRVRDIAFTTNKVFIACEGDKMRYFVP